jgi:hypothetical protein
MSSWSRTRSIAMRSMSPVTEYTSLTPSRAATCCAISGMRATSALMNTMAVIMSPPRLVWSRADAPVR